MIGVWQLQRQVGSVVNHVSTKEALFGKNWKARRSQATSLRAWGASMATILLVEDELLIRMAAADMLVDAGHRVLEAGDADEALLLLRARPDVSVVVTDVKMPGAIDGIALAGLAAHERPYLRFVVVSGHALPTLDELPPQSIFLRKPYYPTQLTAAVATFVEVAEIESSISVEDAVIAPSDSIATGALLSPIAVDAALKCVPAHDAPNSPEQETD